MVTLMREWSRLRALSALMALTVGLLVALPGLNAPASAATPVMGQSVLTADELADWYASTGQRADLPVSVRDLARHFIREGAAEQVRGDLAFAQSILETGYFTFPSAGQVRPSHNNYAGLGAVDGGNTPNAFPSPQIGVRAQIQHLRAYADPTVTESNLANPLVSPRFHLVSPKGRAPRWEDMGGVAADGKVNWASDPHYGAKVLSIYGRISAHAAQRRGSIPLMGDWNGNGVATPGWFRDGRVYLRTANSPGPPNIVFDYGRRGDIPVVGDWNGDGRDTVGVRRGATWYLTNRNGRGAPAAIFNYGKVKDVPVTGDWNRNGQTTVGVHRGATWYLSNRNGRGAPAAIFNYGWASDVPVVGDWNADGRDTVGVRRGATWYLTNRNGRGAPAAIFNYGWASDVPVVGDWNGNGQATPGVVRGTSWYLSNRNSAGPPAHTFRYTGW